MRLYSLAISSLNEQELLILGLAPCLNFQVYTLDTQTWSIKGNRDTVAHWDPNMDHKKEFQAREFNDSEDEYDGEDCGAGPKDADVHDCDKSVASYEATQRDLRSSDEMHEV